MVLFLSLVSNILLQFLTYCIIQAHFPFSSMVCFPLDRWSHKGEYFARISGNNLSVYETPVSSKYISLQTWYYQSIAGNLKPEELPPQLQLLNEIFLPIGYFDAFKFSRLNS